jgi:predicted DNA-binding transcriptional regulator YafY
MAMSEAAQQVEERLGFTVRKSESKAKKWLDRVERLPDWVGFQKPPINLEVEKVIHEALLYETSIEIENDKGKKILHPQAIVQRGVRTYLVALNSDGARLQSYLLSRLISARPITSSAFRLEEQAKIKAHLNKGIAFPEMSADVYGKEVKLKLWGDIGTTGWLKETPLSKDQTIKPLTKSFAKNNPWSEIEATVLVQEELIWWLRSMGPNIQVREPKFIKERICQDLEAALKAYK